MATLKMTFTLDRTAVDKLQQVADRLGTPKSEIVRDAIVEFHDRMGRLSDRERETMLRKFDELVPLIKPRSKRAVDRELAEIREARRSGGRRTA